MQQGGQHGHMDQTSIPTSATHMMDNQLVEEASPISSRPPAGNLDELMHGEDEAGDRGGGSGGGGSGNRWPKQETLALLKIRSEMDAAFKDAPLKGPLWEDVSRKLAGLGYKRNAKKCKEKFENVHKYYKRTKEGRGGRQDGKSYKFFSELEALHSNTSTAAATTNVSSSLAMAAPHVNTNPIIASSSTNFVPLGLASSNPMPISSHHTTITFTPQTQTQTQIPSSNNINNIGTSVTQTTQVPSSIHNNIGTSTPMFPPGMPAAAAPISFSSNSASSSHNTEDDNEEMEEGSSRKRKRGGGSSSNGGSGTKSMMEFFENLMRQVMQKQEVMQQRFLEAIEKRERDRMIREEAWRMQEMARLTREQEIMAQDRTIVAQRDAAIVSFIQKITGQTIQLPQHASVMHTQAQAAPQAQYKKQQPQEQQVAPQKMQPQQSQASAEIVKQTPSKSTDVMRAVPEQQVPPQETSGGGGGSFEQSSSRWPKAEVLALISIRSGLEYRYQEAVPKGPLWEEVSAGMAGLGYKRNSKRCKEKWENINKYYKKVKESNKKRPEDAKTCPYFHQLDALYRQKLFGNTSAAAAGGSSSTSGFGNENRPRQQSQTDVVAAQPSQAAEPENKIGSTDNVQASNVDLQGSLFGEETGGAAQKPEDIMKELIDQQQKPQNQQQLTVDDYDKVDEPDHSDNLDQDEYEDEDEDDNEEVQEQRKMAYKIEFQRQSNAGPPNGGGKGTPSFLAMVQ